MAAQRIPEMFLRALKRKQSLQAASLSTAPLESKEKRSRDAEEDRGEGEVAKENGGKQGAASEPEAGSSTAGARNELTTERRQEETVVETTVPTSSIVVELRSDAESGGGRDTKEVVQTVEKIEMPTSLELDELPVDAPLRELVRDAEWRAALADELARPYISRIEEFLAQERSEGKTVFPPRHEIFAALNCTPLSRVKVVLIGQDPYHNDGQAHGLCFSVKRGVPPPPSLKNMYKELAADIPGFQAPDHGFLEGWARQGVLMLNAALTVRAHEANSHAKIGWYTLTDKLISIVNRELEGVVFLLWGGFAHKKAALVDQKKHAIVQAAHPSPLSARFFLGCRCFSKVNERLAAFGKEPVRWGEL